MNCPACSSSKIKILFKIVDRNFQTTEDRFSLCQCKDCKIRFLFPQPVPEDLSRYYPERYWVDPMDAKKGLREKFTEAYRRAVLFNHVRFVRQIAKDQKKRKIPLRLLDVGCGDGSFLDTAELAPCFGLDISLKAVIAAKARGIDAVQGSLRSNPFPKKSFSLITMFHLLEHVSPAKTYLDAARKLLANNGDLVIQVPNSNSFQARIFKEKWAGYDAPRHLINYSSETLCHTLLRNGFRVVRQTQFSLRDNAPMLGRSIAPGLYPPARSARKGALFGVGPWIADLAFLGITMASLPFTLSESLVGRGATVMVHAKPI